MARVGPQRHRGKKQVKLNDPVRITKSDSENSGMAPLILNLGLILRSVVRLS